MTRRNRYVLYAVVTIVAFVGISIWNFWSVTHPARIVLADMYIDKLGIEEVALETRDGLTLAAWFMQGDVSNGRVVILMHGYPVEKTDMLGIARELRPHFSLLMPDFRYFGDSEGSRTTLGIDERLDVEAAVDFLAERGYEDIGVFGFSMGGAAALMAALSDERIDAAASYASYADLPSLGLDLYGNLSVLKYPMVSLMKLWARLSFGVSIDDVSPVRLAGTRDVPILVSHSRTDEMIPFAHATRLMEALSVSPRAELYEIESGRHGDLPHDFEEHLIDFFDRSFDASDSVSDRHRRLA